MGPSTVYKHNIAALSQEYHRSSLRQEVQSSIVYLLSTIISRGYCLLHSTYISNVFADWIKPDGVG